VPCWCSLRAPQLQAEVENLEARLDEAAEEQEKLHLVRSLGSVQPDIGTTGSSLYLELLLKHRAPGACPSLVFLALLHRRSSLYSDVTDPCSLPQVREGRSVCSGRGRRSALEVQLEEGKQNIEAAEEQLVDFESELRAVKAERDSLLADKASSTQDQEFEATRSAAQSPPGGSWCPSWASGGSRRAGWRAPRGPVASSSDGSRSCTDASAVEVLREVLAANQSLQGQLASAEERHRTQAWRACCRSRGLGPAASGGQGGQALFGG